MQTSELDEAESAAQCLASLGSTSCLLSKQHQPSLHSGEYISTMASTTEPENTCILSKSAAVQPGRVCISETPLRIQSGETYLVRALPAPPAAPCKLLTQLPATPSTDTSQISMVADGTSQPTEIDGVECSKAYQMLIQFAITDDKFDTVAHALDNGCVANKGPSGGCKVPNKVVWKVLDDMLG